MNHKNSDVKAAMPRLPGHLLPGPDLTGYVQGGSDGAVFFAFRVQQGGNTPRLQFQQWGKFLSSGTGLSLPVLPVPYDMPHQPIADYQTSICAGWYRSATKEYGYAILSLVPGYFVTPSGQLGAPTSFLWMAFNDPAADGDHYVPNDGWMKAQWDSASGHQYWLHFAIGDDRKSIAVYIHATYPDGLADFVQVGTSIGDN